MPVEITIQEKKLELIRILSGKDDLDLIEKVADLISPKKNITHLEKESLQKGLKDIEAGKIKEHKEVMRGYGKWL